MAIISINSLFISLFFLSHTQSVLFCSVLFCPVDLLYQSCIFILLLSLLICSHSLSFCLFLSTKYMCVLQSTFHISLLSIKTCSKNLIKMTPTCRTKKKKFGAHTKPYQQMQEVEYSSEGDRLIKDSSSRNNTQKEIKAEENPQHIQLNRWKPCLSVRPCECAHIYKRKPNEAEWRGGKSL